MVAPRKPKVLRDDRLYFTDNGRIVCGQHAGMTAQYTGRDLSGQKVLMVSMKVAKQWLTDFGEPIKCEDCGGPAAEESDHDYTTGWGPSTIVIAPGETKPVPSGAKSLHIVCIGGGGDGTRGDQ